MTITLYQIIPELDKNHLMFRDLQFIRTASGNQVPAELYESVYSGDLDIQTLEDVFYVFNMAHPEGYQGRSMSVSDVVELSGAAGDNEFFFCDSIGFKKITFDKEKAMLPRDDRDRPVYESDGRLYVDVEPRNGCGPNIHTKCNNDSYGEPDMSIAEDTQVEFVSDRDT